MIKISLPGRKDIELHHLILDMNGTLTVDGLLPTGVSERIEQLKTKLKIYLLTADTFGTGAQVANELGIDMFTVSPNNGGQDKADFTSSLNPATVVAVGNGYNDRDMFKRACLSIAVIGQEGCCVAALLNADIAVSSINDGLDLLINPLRLTATLRR